MTVIQCQKLIMYNQIIKSMNLRILLHYMHFVILINVPRLSVSLLYFEMC